MRHARPLIPLAVVPQADLVEVAQADRLRDRVDEHGVGERARDDVGDVDAEEVDVRQNARVGGAAEEHQQREGYGNQSAQRGEQSGYLPAPGGGGNGCAGGASLGHLVQKPSEDVIDVIYYVYNGVSRTSCCRLHGSCYP